MGQGIAHRKVRWEHGLANRGTRDQPAWYCRFSDGGKQTTMPTHQPSKELARRFLAEIRARVARGEAPIPPKATATEQQRRILTIRELCNTFTEGYSRPRIKNLRAYLVGTASTFRCRVLPYSIAERPVNEVQPREIAALRDQLVRDGYSAHSVNGMLDRLGTAIEWGMDQGLLPASRNPVSRVERLPVEEWEGRYSAEAAHKLLARPLDVLTAMVAVALYTGMRKGELYGLRWESVHLEAEVPWIDVRRSYRGTTKSGKPRPIPIHPALREVLRRWESECPETEEDLVFPLRMHKPWHGRWYRMGRGADQAGLVELLQELRIHVPTERSARPGKEPAERAWLAFRHTFSSALHEATRGNWEVIAELLGHSKRGRAIAAGAARVTAGYTHTGRLEYLSAELAKLTYPAPAGVTDIKEARRRRAA